MSTIISILLSFSVLINPVQSNPNEHITYEFVGSVYCDNINQSCHSDTIEDISGGYWVIDIDNPNNLTLEALNSFYKGKLVKITYTGDILDDESIDIVDTQILN